MYTCCMSYLNYNAILIYLALMNIACFFAIGIDKHQAKNHRRRIPEAALLISAGIGGSVGCLIGMRAFHHKTRKFKFKFGVPAILFVQATLVLCAAGIAVFTSPTL